MAQVAHSYEVALFGEFFAKDLTGNALLLSLSPSVPPNHAQTDMCVYVCVCVWPYM